MMPDNKTQEQIDGMIISLARDIILNDLIVDSNSPQTKEDFRMVIRHSQEWEVDEGYLDVSHLTTSESQGYGMMIIAYMAGSEQKLNLGDKWIFGCTSMKDYYDAMLRTVLAFPSAIGPKLFTWEIFGYPRGGDNATGYKTDGEIKSAPFSSDSKSGDSATDGDMDIIYSLIVADKQWGSGGKYNYIGIARDMLGDLWDYCIDSEYHTLLLGDWAKKSNNNILKHATRPCDFIISHLKVYKKIDPLHDWQSVIDASYNVIKEIRCKENGMGNTNGLLPDFLQRGEDGWEVPAENILESYDGAYAYNACRVPWRLGTDYLLFGNTQIGDSTLFDYIIKPIDDFARNFSKGNVNKFGPFYMDGTPFNWTDPDLFTPPFLVTAAGAASDQKWVNSLWNFRGLSKRNGDTYGDYIKLLVMLTVSGKFWLPVEK